MSKFNVIALGARDYYQVALALDEHDLLHRVVTDFYTPDFLRKPLKKRFEERLSSKKSISLIAWMRVYKAAYRITKWRKAEHISTDYFFGFITGLYTYMSCNRAVVYSYYLEGFTAFYRLIKKEPEALVVFQVHPTPWHVNRVLSEDQDCHIRAGGGGFLPELEVNYSDDGYHRYLQGVRDCDAVLCASTFTAKSVQSLEEVDLPFFVAPYGNRLAGNIDGALEVPSVGEALTGKVKLLSVCQVIQRKGLHHAFAAMRGFEESFEWEIVATRVDEEISRLAPSNVRFLSSLTDSELAEKFEQSDLFVMPSLIEGFGLVYVESASFGTPVLCTENTGAADFIVHDETGYVVDPGSPESIRAVFQKVAADPGQLRIMRSKVKSTARSLTWGRFREKVVDAVKAQVIPTN